jgi:hypothetical protein
VLEQSTEGSVFNLLRILSRVKFFYKAQNWVEAWLSRSAMFDGRRAQNLPPECVLANGNRNER